MALLTNSFNPLLLLAIDMVSMTGQPNFLLKSSTLISVSFFSLISLLFNATTIGTPNSINCVVKNKLRLRLVASTILIMASKFALLIYVLVTLSSDVNGDIEYAPGKSTAITSSVRS